MKNYLFDTTVVIDYLRYSSKITALFDKIQSPAISVVTVCEVYQGASNRIVLNKIKLTLSNFKVFPLTESISQKLLQLIEEYHLSYGLLIPDALIAATAMENNFTMLTSNLRHFQMIKGLKMEKW